MLPDSVLDALESRIVNEVAGETGFLTVIAENAYIKAGKKLLDAGWHGDDIIYMLSSLYWCASVDFR